MHTRTHTKKSPIFLGLKKEESAVQGTTMVLRGSRAGMAAPGVSLKPSEEEASAGARRGPTSCPAFRTRPAGTRSSPERPLLSRPRSRRPGRAPARRFQEAPERRGSPSAPTRGSGQGRGPDAPAAGRRAGAPGGARGPRLPRTCPSERSARPWPRRGHVLGTPPPASRSSVPGRSWGLKTGVGAPGPHPAPGSGRLRGGGDRGRGWPGAEG